MADPNYYRPDIQGWSSDILPWYAARANELPDGCKYVELGVHHGRSLLFLAEYLYDQGKFKSYVIGFDTWHEEGSWEAFEKNRRSVWPANNLIITDRKPSAEAAELYDDESVDLVFIDADHTYAAVKADIDAWWPKIKRGRCFGGHDYRADLAQAVDEFALANKLHVHHFSSVWWVVKP